MDAHIIVIINDTNNNNNKKKKNMQFGTKTEKFEERDTERGS
jgi:hypothetical protein